TGNRPALMLLHGIDGLDGEHDAYRCVARRLAGRGYVVYVPHYFDRTATRAADLPHLMDLFQSHLKGTNTEADRAAVCKQFSAWTDTVADTLVHARKQAGVDGARVGVAGISLGRYLATSVAALP